VTLGNAARATYRDGVADLRILPLGGLGEVGMNCLALEQDGRVLLVDAGVTFDARGFGLDVVHPDFSCLEPYEGRIEGLVLTHGHEDHIGAVPYLLERFDIPVFGPPYALELLRSRRREHEILDDMHAEELVPGSRRRLGRFDLEAIRVAHSIADSLAFAFRTAAGTVVHTGDFRFDGTVAPTEQLDVARFRALGKEGVALLMSDSTNVQVESDAVGEGEVADRLESVIAQQRAGVVLGMFASNTVRMRRLGRIARATGRRLVPLGRSMVNHLQVARKLGYLPWPEELLWPADRIGELRRNEWIAVATGTQAEDYSALQRLARDEHHQMRLQGGDTVLMSSRVIPGHELQVTQMIGGFLRQGVEVVTAHDDALLHASGHATAPDQRRMIQETMPGAFLPLHGTRLHLEKHARIAKAEGVRSVVVAEDGEWVRFDGASLRPDGKEEIARTWRAHGREVAESLVLERRLLAQEGLVVAILHVPAEGASGAQVVLVSRGVFGSPALERDAHYAARDEVKQALAQASKEGRRKLDPETRESVQRAVRRAIQRVAGYRPTVHLEVIVSG
jgi:ribonuclease J